MAQPAPSLEAAQQKLLDRRLEEALGEVDAVLAASPEQSTQRVEALYLKAVCLRYARRLPEALATLQELKQLAPDHGRAHQEEGHSLRAAERLDDALRAYARACACNEALIAAWRGQLELAQALGRQGPLPYLRSQLAWLEGLPKPLLAVLDLIGQGKLLNAEDLCRQFLQKVPHQVDAMRLLADIATRLGVLDDAELLLEGALKLEPRNARVRMDYVQVLRKRQQFERAREQAQILRDSDPQNLQYRSLYAIECMQTGDYERALDLFDSILEKAPADPITLTSKGHALKTCGRSADAIAAYRVAATSQPRHGEAYYALANLKTYRFGEDEIERMQALEADPGLSHMDRVYLAFALGKALEDAGRFEAAFACYARGNRLKKQQSRYSADQMHDEVEAQQRVCTRALFQRRRNTGHPAPDPIFIVGLPRAGSTLLEQILSSHSLIDGTLELPNILALSHRLRRGGRLAASSRYPDDLVSLPDEQLARFGRDYIEQTRIHRQSAPFFIDKMPNNFRHIGLIRLILPNAKIIDARRAPMACCFSAYKQLFAEGQEFSYDLEDLGRYYRDYVELMDHWDTVLPGFVLRVQHEDVVADLEGQVRRMLDFIGVPFEAACLEYHRTERHVRTPSSEQVRQPIFTDALEQWRHFEPWLGPLKAALGEELAASGTAAAALPAQSAPA